jgi:hypothetical protein
VYGYLNVSKKKYLVCVSAAYVFVDESAVCAFVAYVSQDVSVVYESLDV